MKKHYKNLYLHDIATGIIAPVSIIYAIEEGDDLYIEVLRKSNSIII